MLNDKQNDKQNLEHFSTSSKYTGIQNLITVSTSPSTKIKKKHLESMNLAQDTDPIKPFNIESSIRQKSDLEKWRNKQRQREREFDFESRRASIQDNVDVKKRVTSLTREEVQKMNEIQLNKMSPVDKQIRNEISIITTSNNDVLYSSPSNKQQEHNVILSENVKLHSPTRVHVLHKPTVSDTSRVYNPYPIKNEYDKYTKNGFLFESLNQQGQQNEIVLTKSEQRRLSTQLMTKPNINNANVAFSSESISPYTRKDNKIIYKNAVDNDHLLNLSRGYVNTQFKKETEFQNFNNLKQQRETSLLEHNPDYSTSVPQQQQQQLSNNKLYEDEYDIANKLKRKPEQNMRLINSINNELKKFHSGHQQD